MHSQPFFLQGVFAFTGQGYTAPTALGDLGYTVPSDRRSQLIYFRAGNSSAELIYIQLLRDGNVMRLFPVGAKADVHVQLAVVEDLFGATELTVQVAVPANVSGTVVLDVGFLEIP